MCQERISVRGLHDQRTAYEVQEYLRGIPYVNSANADFIEDVVVVEYDESEITHEKILDEIEYSGCKPAERIDGLLDKVRHQLLSY